MEVLQTDSWQEALELKAAQPDAVPVCGGTDLMVELNFDRSDRYTSLAETSDRILATIITARWSYRGREIAFGAAWHEVRRTILEAFCDHYSPSVQVTLHHMGQAVLAARQEVERISFSLPNKHHLLYDLGRFGLENASEIFHATNEPYGLIEGTVERSQHATEAR